MYFFLSLAQVDWKSDVKFDFRLPNGISQIFHYLQLVRKATLNNHFSHSNLILSLAVTKVVQSIYRNNTKKPKNCVENIAIFDVADTAAGKYGCFACEIPEKWVVVNTASADKK